MKFPYKLLRILRTVFYGDKSEYSDLSFDEFIVFARTLIPGFSKNHVFIHIYDFVQKCIFMPESLLSSFNISSVLKSKISGLKESENYITVFDVRIKNFEYLEERKMLDIYCVLKYFVESISQNTYTANIKIRLRENAIYTERFTHKSHNFPFVNQQ